MKEWQSRYDPFTLSIWCIKLPLAQTFVPTHNATTGWASKTLRYQVVCFLFVNHWTISWPKCRKKKKWISDSLWPHTIDFTSCKFDIKSLWTVVVKKSITTYYVYFRSILKCLFVALVQLCAVFQTESQFDWTKPCAQVSNSTFMGFSWSSLEPKGVKCLVNRYISQCYW